jgi:hypothetical protein
MRDRERAWCTGTNLVTPNLDPQPTVAASRAIAAASRLDLLHFIDSASISQVLTSPISEMVTRAVTIFDACPNSALQHKA